MRVPDEVGLLGGLLFAVTIEGGWGFDKTSSIAFMVAGLGGIATLLVSIYQDHRARVR